MNYIDFIHQSKPLAVGAIMCLSALNASAKNDQKPNVVFILTDDQGYGDMHCLGNKYLQTPNMDKLHGQAVRLSNFHADATSSPTRASIMTGKYSSRTGVWHTLQGRSIMDSQETTMAEVFRENGYRTGIFGKWHLGDSYPYHPSYRGFEESVIHGGGGIAQNPDYWRNDYFDDMYMHNREWKFYEGYCTDVWFREATRFIRSNKDEPFFCMIPVNAPHFWYFVPEKYALPYREQGMSDQRSRFFGMITCIDDNIGALRGEIEKLGIADNTIIIFMTDNGSGFMKRDEYFYNAGMRGGKASIYEGGHRVPFFIYYKDGQITGGRDMKELTAHIDIFPTLIDLCGLKNKHKIDFDGQSLARSLRNESKPNDDRTIVVHHQRVDKPVKYKDYCVMTGDWRMINGTELYNIAADPGQQTNLADKEPTIVKSMLLSYEKWWDRISDRFEQYSEIYLGAEQEKISWLTCHDWHSDNLMRTWNQDVIRSKEHDNGYWTVKVVRGGKYRITLRTFPVQEDIQMNVTNAKMRIGEKEFEKKCYAGSSEITFNAVLESGSFEMQTWLQGVDNKVFGAPYAYVEYIE